VILEEQGEDCMKRLPIKAAEIQTERKTRVIKMSGISGDWYEALKGEFSKPYYRTLFQTVNEEYRTRLIFPPAEDIFNAFHLTPLKKRDRTPEIIMKLFINVDKRRRHIHSLFH